MTIRRVLTLVTLLGLIEGATAHAVEWRGIHDFVASSRPLAHSNGQKIVTGVGSILHLVYEDFGEIKYSKSSDGLTWSSPTVLACSSPGRLPTIAAGGNGRLGVVWVDNLSTSLQYVYYNGSTWSTPTTIVNDGDEPSIVARGQFAHLTWRSAAAERIYYQAFEIDAPTLLMGEVVDQSSCVNDQFRLPSIALTRASDPCDPPVPVIGFLFSTNTCLPGSTIGPRVFKRDNTLGTWSITWQAPLSGASTSVQPISISLSSRFAARELYVAFSDVQGGTARTMIGRGNSATWTWFGPEPIDNQERHIHVRANEANTAPLGTFRLARSPDGPFGAQYRDGVWTGLSPSWSTLSWIDGFNPSVGRPHATWWKDCRSDTRTDVLFAGEEDLAVGNGGPKVGTEIEQVTPCPPNGPIVSFPKLCHYAVLRMATLLGPGAPPVTVIDMTEAGIIKSFTDKGAVVITENGGRIDVTWGPGKVVGTSESTISLTSSADSVRISSSTVRFSVEDLGTLSGYDRAPGGEVCSR